MLDQLALGLAQIATLTNLAVLVLGLLVGMLVAILPGLTLVMGVALALPFTYTMGMIPSVILLTAIYVSGTYGGAFTSILFRVPGEPFDIPLLWDGHAMARAGRAAEALGLVLLATLFGGFLSLLFMIAVAEPFARVAVRLSTAEYFALILFGIASVVSLGGGSLVNALISLCVGLLVASVGVDQTYGVDRYSFGLQTLSDGIEYVAVMIGAYGLGEVLTRLESGAAANDQRAAGGSIRTVLPTLADAIRLRWALLRSTAIGILVGVVPGAGATVASFVAYGAEGQYGSRRTRLGSGIAEGVVAPQAASTASVGGAMTSLLTLGIPGSGTTAIMYGAFLLHGVQPGPQLFAATPEIPNTIFATMLVSLIGMCLIGYLFIRALVRVLEAPEALVAAFVVAFCFVGTLAVRNSVNDLALGADVEGVDLARPLDVATVAEIERAWMDHLVLRFREQELDQDRLTAFSQRFGVLDKAPVRAASVREYANPYVLLVSNIVENGQAIGSLGNYEASWHIDMSYLDNPPIGSVLYAVEVPPRGGETGFGNLYRAYETLPAELKVTIDGRACTHDASYNSAGELRQGFAAVTDPREAPGARHPLVRPHSVTGRKTLFLGRRRNAYIHGLPLAESEEILDRLWAHAALPEHTWYQEWRVGDAVMWDNRCTIHRRESFDQDSRRLMLRTQIGSREAAAAAA